MRQRQRQHGEARPERQHAPAAEAPVQAHTRPSDRRPARGGSGPATARRRPICRRAATPAAGAAPRDRGARHRRRGCASGSRSRCARTSTVSMDDSSARSGCGEGSPRVRGSTRRRADARALESLHPRPPSARVALRGRDGILSYDAAVDEGGDTVGRVARLCDGCNMEFKPRGWQPTPLAQAALMPVAAGELASAPAPPTD